jgi:hypothetical protein
MGHFAAAARVGSMWDSGADFIEEANYSIRFLRQSGKHSAMTTGRSGINPMIWSGATFGPWKVS